MMSSKFRVWDSSLSAKPKVENILARDAKVAAQLFAKKLDKQGKWSSDKPTCTIKVEKTTVKEGTVVSEYTVRRKLAITFKAKRTGGSKPVVEKTPLQAPPKKKRKTSKKASLIKRKKVDAPSTLI